MFKRHSLLHYKNKCAVELPHCVQHNHISFARSLFECGKAFVLVPSCSITVEPLSVDSLKCKKLHIQDTFVKSQFDRIMY